ncbi:EamA family transporter [Tamilnaduibacter salinus]|uniref:EamA family transporter n=1 Tax=Tamilnaduibacter salinus TaxID=1484056 RepID=A0A2A2I0F2_9GAMM|nr:DMT family transporter [Tamilnaduibacter salinus]PAV25501.1 EamA family transporter [Tamilnaduibacter salinus]
MIAFAGNSVLCRAALIGTDLDPASFTTIRLASGALMLWLLIVGRDTGNAPAPPWRSAIALAIYAACFSFSYVDIATGTGAVLLFGAVQVTMVVRGWLEGERVTALQGVGFALAFGGLVVLLLPTLHAPPLGPALLMVASGVAWGFYTLWGRGSPNPLANNARNFLRSVPLVVAVSLLMIAEFQWDLTGAAYAIASGAITSAIGYAIWYSVLPHLKAAKAASIQLSVPVIATAGGLVFLGEPLTLPFVLISATILAGVGLVIFGKKA